jgi:hypothetical protein
MEGTKGVNPIFSKFHKMVIEFYKFHYTWKTKKYKGLKKKTKRCLEAIKENLQSYYHDEVVKDFLEVVMNGLIFFEKTSCMN